MHKLLGDVPHIPVNPFRIPDFDLTQYHVPEADVYNLS